MFNNLQDGAQGFSSVAKDWFVYARESYAPESVDSKILEFKM